MRTLASIATTRPHPQRFEPQSRASTLVCMQHAACQASNNPWGCCSGRVAAAASGTASRLEDAPSGIRVRACCLAEQRCSCCSYSTSISAFWLQARLSASLHKPESNQASTKLTVGAGQVTSLTTQLRDLQHLSPGMCGLLPEYCCSALNDPLLRSARWSVPSRWSLASRARCRCRCQLST